MGSSSIKTKRNTPLIIISVWISVLGVCAVLVSPGFLAPMAVLMGVVGIYAIAMKCPHCQTDIFRREDLSIWCRFQAPATCRQCNEDIM